MLFNRQIMRYAGTDALAVYGIIVNVSTIVQCCGYSVGKGGSAVALSALAQTTGTELSKH